MKKILSAIFCICMLISTFSQSAGAISINSSRDDLNAQLLDGEVRGTDYVYYLPVKPGDTTKYPLLVWLHGNSSGEYPRQQLQWYGFSNWASDEYQSRFENAGGCILFAPRANSPGNTWDGVTTGELKKVIDGFISDHRDNVDMSRIYVSGYSVGGDMTWSMLLAYPDFFAAGIPCSAITPPTSLGVSSLTDTSVWMVNCDIDYYSTARTSVIRPVFNKLSEISNRKDGIRLTNLSQAVFAGDYKHNSYQEEHFTWETVTYDMHMADGVTPYKYATTTDGNGNIISFENPEEGVISWLSRQTNEKADTDDGGNGGLSGIAAFFNKILEFFKRIFSIFFG